MNRAGAGEDAGAVAARFVSGRIGIVLGLASLGPPSARRKPCMRRSVSGLGRRWALPSRVRSSAVCSPLSWTVRSYPPPRTATVK